MHTDLNMKLAYSYTYAHDFISQKHLVFRTLFFHEFMLLIFMNVCHFQGCFCVLANKTIIYEYCSRGGW